MHKLLAVSIFASALLAGHAARAQTAPAVASFPLAADEQLVPFRNGCNQIVRTGESKAVEYNWYGSCKFGVADGQGFVVALGKYADGKYHLVSMKLGRPSGSPPATSSSYRIVSLPRGADRDFAETVLTRPPFVADPGDSSPQVTSNRGEFALFILVSSARKYDGQELKETLWIARRPCPVFCSSNYRRVTGGGSDCIAGSGTASQSCADLSRRSQPPEK